MMQKRILVSATTLGLIACLCIFADRQRVSAANANSGERVPILVELFTSEGCSSCPPADAQLQRFDAQPLPGVRLIVLSEHVDYWNHIGWTDPYSSRSYSDRQNAYGRRFHLESVYTPQMVVDGTTEFVGGSSRDAEHAFEQAKKSKASLELSGLTLRDGLLQGHIESGALPEGAHKADVVIAIALNRAESQVARGENAGRQLTHVAVVRTFQRVGVIQARQAFSGEISLPVDRSLDPNNLRVIAFLQEAGQGRVWGSTESPLQP